MNVKKSEDKVSRINAVMILVFAAFILVRAFLAPIQYSEIDSHALPVISLQYRQSIFMNESDLVKAQQDFPVLYHNINKFEDLRSAKLVLTEDNKWMSYYFPIYPLLCIPFKLLLSLFRVTQERTFMLTNATLIILAIYFLYKKLKVAPEKKLMVTLLLMLSPIFLYANYLAYESFMFAMVTMALVQYYNKCWKSSALLLSLAGMSNSSVMAIGVIMIGEYLFNVIRSERGKGIRITISSNLKNIVLYGCCYIPCLIPLIVQKASLGESLFVGAYEGLGARWLTYIFDPSVGLFSFGAFTTVMFFVLVMLSVIKRNYQAISWFLFLASTVLAFSLMFHINCGMIYCARYLVWTWPIVAVFVPAIGLGELNSSLIRKALSLIIVGSTCLLLLLNISTAGSYNFNLVTKLILHYAPGLYNPYSATFYCRTLHIDGAYNIVEPAYFEDVETGEMRKLIFKAEPGEAEKVKSMFSGEEQSITYLEDELDSIPLDGKFHYINRSRFSNYQLSEKTPEEKGELVEKATIMERSDFSLITNGELQIIEFPVILRPNTFYRVDLEVGEGVNPDDTEAFFLDFCGKDYDRADQERGGFLKKEECKYRFYIDSGEFDGATIEALARVVAVSDVWTEGMPIEHFSVTEMEQIAS